MSVNNQKFSSSTIVTGLPAPKCRGKCLGKASNVIQFMNLAAQNYGLPLGSNLVQAQVPVLVLGNNNELYVQIEEAIRNTFEVGARPTIQPVFSSPHPVNINMEHSYLVN